MLRTRFKDLYNEINETITEFCQSNEADIFLDAQDNGQDENNLNVQVIVNEKEYNFCYTLREEILLLEKRYFKRDLKLSLYKSLSDYYSMSLPWGALTGIRPSKLAYQQLEDFGEYLNFFRKDMLVSDKKTEIVRKILEEQKPYYEKDDKNCDFFASIPFCPSRCAYCSFLSCEIGREKYVKQYVEAISREISESKKLINNLRSVYVGGGTPVSLELEDFEKVMDAIGNPHVEYTVEAGRPDCINSDNLGIMKNHGVTRICVNPQTFCDETLVRLGRKHTSQDIVDKYELSKKYGFDVNMDLIAGLVGEDFEIFKDSIKKAISLSPENITVHTLCLKRGSKLKESVLRLDDSQVGKMVDYAHEELEKAGYSPYYLYRQKYMAGNLENTGYTKKGKACIYNIDIMEEIAQIIACGANSVSKMVENRKNKLERYGAPKDILTYIQKIDEINAKKSELFSIVKNS